MKTCSWLMRGISVLSWLVAALCVGWLVIAKLEGDAWTDRPVTQMTAALLAMIWVAINARQAAAEMAAADRLAKSSPSNETLMEWAEHSRSQHELED